MDRNTLAKAPAGHVRSHTQLLHAATHPTHDLLDKAIMGHRPFADRERYGLFLRTQHGFHRDIDALYDDAGLAGLLPDLRGRRRLGLIERDLADLGVEPPAPDGDPAFLPGAAVDLPTALGWLYVAEGSNLGAAFLLKEAAKLGFSESFGARHLAGAPEGRGLHWRTFTTAFDAIPLDGDGEVRLIDGAVSGFARVLGFVDRQFRVPGQGRPSVSREDQRGEKHP
ncbi:Heme oxygenase-like protein [uncultured Pleomorphomonas sp.]|uniref:Biliverdin-producing heme oxygenase n=3 Tax=Pleomorphomonas TaxID=261933 RepID=A0A2G9WZS0_9HYPH|nr:biliverdin-producing heme oxygenase [uncultured Pleomorphomonas sp.]PIP00164.1 biliverdin-producing heme oxygenase [Pleomorphomonas carboxyditropha]SCM76274.1 Heme oxygenase-like protein [uncultured Pleomorphomonas sp.]